MIFRVKAKVFRRIGEIPPEDWNPVFPRVLEGYPFFKSLDESGFDQFSFYYILVYEGEAPVGAAPCFLMNYPLETTLPGFLNQFVVSVKKRFPSLFNLKALICGLPMGQGRMGLGGEGGQAFEKILETMDEIAKEEKAAVIVFKDFNLSYAPLLDPLQKRGFYKFESLPSTEMDVSFMSFEDYLKGLSRSSREGIKRKFKKLEGRGKIELEISDELNGTLDEVHGLYLQTMAKAVREGETQFEIVPKEFFEKVSRNMPGETKYFLWRLEGKVVAFAFCLVSEERFIDYYLGFDYQVAYDYHLYYVRFRDLLNWCIAQKIKKYEMGPTSYESKRRLGFDFIRLFGYAKHRRPWVNPFFKILCALLRPENFDPVFKEMRKKK